MKKEYIYLIEKIDTDLSKSIELEDKINELCKKYNTTKESDTLAMDMKTLVDCSTRMYNLRCVLVNDISSIYVYINQRGPIDIDKVKELFCDLEIIHKKFTNELIETYKLAETIERVFCANN
jgi:hypothetical protein